MPFVSGLFPAAVNRGRPVAGCPARTEEEKISRLSGPNGSIPGEVRSSSRRVASSPPPAYWRKNPSERLSVDQVREERSIHSNAPWYPYIGSALTLASSLACGLPHDPRQYTPTNSPKGLVRNHQARRARGMDLLVHGLVIRSGGSKRRVKSDPRELALLPYVLSAEARASSRRKTAVSARRLGKR